MKDWVERAEDELDNDLAEGRISQDEYWRYQRELHQEVDEVGYYDSGYQGEEMTSITVNIPSVVIDITPAKIAEAFWNMNAEEQAKILC